MLSMKLRVKASLSAAAGYAIAIGIRPEHFDREAELDAMIAIAIDFVEHLGGTPFVHGHASTSEKIIAEHRDAGAIKSEQAVTVGFSAKDLRAFNSEGLRLR